MGRSKTNLSKWGYADTADTACECGTSEQTMQHLLRYPLLKNECSLEDLATANEKALHCARAWPNIWLSSGMIDTKDEWITSSTSVSRGERSVHAGSMRFPLRMHRGVAVAARMHTACEEMDSQFIARRGPFLQCMVRRSWHLPIQCTA